MSVPRIAALCACAALLLCSCDKNEDSSQPAEDKTSRVTTVQPASPVEVKEYKYPEFLDSKETDDMLSNVLSAGFDINTAVTRAEISELGGYKPILCLLGEYYTFREEGKIGLLNKDGKVIVKTDRFVDATPVSNHIIQLDYPAAENKEPELMFVNGGMGMIINNEFDPSKIKIEETETEEGKKICSLSIFGVQDPRRYDTVVPVKAGEIRTSAKYAAAYKATSGNKKYYLLLDEYYNLTVCEGVYGRIAVKAGGRYGECYILDGDHSSELYKMIKSFGSTDQDVKPTKDETLDFIQITFGTDTADRTVVTVSSEGFCLTDAVSGGGQNVNKSFSVFSKDTFTDLVNWVDEVASQEYPQARMKQTEDENAGS